MYDNKNYLNYLIYRLVVLLFEENGINIIFDFYFFIER